jgi:hypothetical protein
MLKSSSQIQIGLKRSGIHHQPGTGLQISTIQCRNAVELWLEDRRPFHFRKLFQVNFIGIFDAKIDTNIVGRFDSVSGQGPPQHFQMVTVFRDHFIRLL